MHPATRQRLKRIVLACQNRMLPRRSLEHLQALRLKELEAVLEVMPRDGRLLEVGAGTGWQARQLAERGYDVEAIDVADSNYRAERVWPVTDYDGVTIPFADASFDIVFSSNTLEHIRQLDDFERELHRVLRPQGVAVHVLPSASWRFWTNVTHPIRYFVPPFRHGEHAANALTEIVWFSRRVWRRHFERTGWVVRMYSTNRLFYTGCSVADHRLSMDARMRLARYLGSACHVFVLVHAGRAA